MHIKETTRTRALETMGLGTETETVKTRWVVVLIWGVVVVGCQEQMTMTHPRCGVVGPSRRNEDHHCWKTTRTSNDCVLLWDCRLVHSEQKMMTQRTSHNGSSSPRPQGHGREERQELSRIGLILVSVRSWRWSHKTTGRALVRLNLVVGLSSRGSSDSSSPPPPFIIIFSLRVDTS